MPLPTNLATAHALILRQREELAAAEARALGAEALIAHMKLVIAKLRRQQYGQSSERGRKVLDQFELQLEELEAETSENAVAAEDKAAGVAVKSFARQRPVRAPLPAHLPRERVIIPAPCACPVCGGRLAKLGEDITETLEIVPRQWKVVQTVREKFTCRSCEKITQPPAPFHAIARARAGASLLAMILYAKFGQHQPEAPTRRVMVTTKAASSAFSPRTAMTFSAICRVVIGSVAWRRKSRISQIESRLVPYPSAKSKRSVRSACRRAPIGAMISGWCIKQNKCPLAAQWTPSSRRARRSVDSILKR